MTPSNLSQSLTSAAPKLTSLLNSDPEYTASSQGASTTFHIKSVDGDVYLTITILNGHTTVSTEPFISTDPWTTNKDARFTLFAKQQHWEHVFSARPPPPFQSYWGMMRTLGEPQDVNVEGDLSAFYQHARLWRMFLDRTRDALNSTSTSIPDDHSAAKDLEDLSSISGHYTTITTPLWGRCQIFYERAGTGPQNILFLHTAGADSRQSHSLMINPTLQQRCTMYAFDLPGHGRSYPGSWQHPEGYRNDEENYIAAISAVIRNLGLKDVIVCGASMAGEICLAVATRAKEMGVVGVIPCEGCEYLNPFAHPYPTPLGGANESILNPERVCGMISPTAPAERKKLIWWIYSSQAAQVFLGDLKFYFEGWDGRGRMEKIDTRSCPVYMLTGEYDYSCTPEASRKTAENIKGGERGEFVVAEEMKGMGHFPLTEDPETFVPYFLRALEFVQKNSEGLKGEK